MRRVRIKNRDSVENLCTMELPKVEVQIEYELLSGPCMIVCIPFGYQQIPPVVFFF